MDSEVQKEDAHMAKRSDNALTSLAGKERAMAGGYPRR